jgi:hypothetical protein
VLRILVGKAKGKRLFGKHGYFKERMIFQFILKEYDWGRGMFIRGRTITNFSVVKLFFNF